MFNFLQRYSIVLCTVLMLLAFTHDGLVEIYGDFDGDGVEEKAWMMMQAENNEIHFGNRDHIPSLHLGSITSVYNLGDVDQNSTHELLVLGLDNTDPFSHPYTLYSFDSLNRAWFTLVYANAPTQHPEDPQKWVYQQHDTLFYWSSVMHGHDHNLKDTLCWRLR